MPTPERDIVYGRHRLRIRPQASGFAGIVVGDSHNPVFGPSRAEVTRRLQRLVHAQDPRFVGLDGARARFLELFPGGFSDPDYLGRNGRGERDYKMKRVQEVAETLPLDRVTRDPAAPAVALRIFRGINLADPFTKTRLGEVLTGPRAARFLAIAADFAAGEIGPACRRLEAEFAAEGVNNWVCLTFFPFFWRPEAHMFLKPAFTCDFAGRIGHPLAVTYEARPNPETYAALLDMAGEVARSVADLGPRDMIDIHSFMWATVNY